MIKDIWKKAILPLNSQVKERFVHAEFSGQAGIPYQHFFLQFLEIH